MSALGTWFLLPDFRWLRVYPQTLHCRVVLIHFGWKDNKFAISPVMFGLTQICHPLVSCRGRGFRRAKNLSRTPKQTHCFDTVTSIHTVAWLLHSSILAYTCGYETGSRNIRWGRKGFGVELLLCHKDPWGWKKVQYTINPARQREGEDYEYRRGKREGTWVEGKGTVHEDSVGLRAVMWGKRRKNISTESTRRSLRQIIR